MSTELFLLATLLLYTFGSELKEDGSSSRYKTLRFFFPHFFHFPDMVQQELITQRLGVKSTEKVLMQIDRLPIISKIYYNLTKTVDTVISHAISLLDINDTEVDFNAYHYTFIDGEPKLPGCYLAALTRHVKDDSTYTAVRNLTWKFLPHKKHKSPQSLLALIMYAWPAIFLWAIGCSHNLVVQPPGAVSSPSLQTANQDEWALRFIVAVCNIHRQRNLSLSLSLPHGFCPNPCLAQPCDRVPSSLKLKCTPKGTGQYQYECECPINNKWIGAPDTHGTCNPIDKCETECDPVGTKTCENFDEGHRCVCRPTHMGPRCNMLRDPCLQPTPPVTMPGNLACNTGRGGICASTKGTDFYTCHCPFGWTSEATLPYPNCLALKDSCGGDVCIRGDCISSRDGTESFCVCSEESFGESCEFVRGRWAQWSPWSVCTPACGLTTQRLRSRTRDCLGDGCLGGGGHFQLDVCLWKPCPDEVVAWGRGGRHDELSELKLMMTQAKAHKYIKTTTAVAQTLLLMCCIFAVAVSVALIFIAYCL